MTFYVIEVCADSSQGHETPPHGPPVHLPEYISDQDDPADENGNNKIDDWGAVVDTSDNCSKNFDLNDRLGTNYGGTNTERPDHTGVDIQANIGDTVASMAFGRVVDVGNGVGGADCGKAVKIVNLFASGINGTTAVYCHLSSTSVQKGEFVIAGQDIGEVGMTGATTGPHLHISLWATTSSNSQRLEYFNYVDNGPTTAQLNPNGC